GGVALWRSASQHAALNDIVFTRIPITKSMGMLADGVNVQAIQFRNLALTTSDDIVKRSSEQVATARASIAKQMETLGRSSGPTRVRRSWRACSSTARLSSRWATSTWA